MFRAAEGIFSCRLFLKPGNRLVDDLQGGFVAGPGVVSPCKESVAFQNDPASLRIFKAEFFQPQAQFIARALPGQPADVGAEDLLRDCLAVACRGNGDDCVRMHMVDMAFRHIGMKRGVDGGGARVQVEGAMGQAGDHLVFKLDAAIEPFKCPQLVHVECRKTIHLDGADIAARALDPQYLDLIAGEGILLHRLGGGVAATVVGDALVGAQEV